MEYDTLAKLTNTNVMRNALKWIFHSVEKNVRAVPRDPKRDLPPHDIIIEAKPNGGTAKDVQNAIERNIAVLATLMPHEHVVAIDVPMLQTLLQVWKLNGGPEMSVEDIHGRALRTLRGFGYHKGMEIDSAAMSDLENRDTEA